MTNPITLAERTVSALAKVITGDPIKKNGPKVAPYRSCPEIMRFFNEFGFNEFGFNDVYSWGGGAPTRYVLAENRIRDLMSDPVKFALMVEEALAPAHFREHEEFPLEKAVEFLAPYLRDDGQELVLVNGRYKLRGSLTRVVVMENKPSAAPEVNQAFIDEMILKCDQKLAGGDYSGAITNARTLIEAVFQAIERRLDASPPAYDGDLQKLYKRLRGLLNLDPKGGETQPFHLVLVGLSNVVDGLAPMRNRMSDAHPLTYKPEKHHAKLAVNAAKTVADFVFDTFEYQVGKGKLKPVAMPS